MGTQLLPTVHTINGLMVECEDTGVWVNGQRRFGVKGLGKTVNAARLAEFWATIPTLNVDAVELWAMLQTAAVLPKKPAVDTTFRPLDIGDGFGGHVFRACARDGIGGPCWGKVEWVETRDLQVGACQKPLCQGHRAARYKPAA